jgi:hypothetical protein
MDVRVLDSGKGQVYNLGSYNVILFKKMMLVRLCRDWTTFF